MQERGQLQSRRLLHLPPNGLQLRRVLLLLDDKSLTQDNLSTTLLVSNGLDAQIKRNILCMKPCTVEYVVVVLEHLLAHNLGRTLCWELLLFLLLHFFLPNAGLRLAHKRVENGVGTVLLERGYHEQRFVLPLLLFQGRVGNLGIITLSTPYVINVVHLLLPDHLRYCVRVLDEHVLWCY